jgi:hypothetical protein
MDKLVFNLEDYNSPDGMMTLVWGPPMWHVLHTISFNYPVKPTKEDKINYYNFIVNLKYILPCKYCRDNLKKNFKKLSFNKSVFKSRDAFSLFIYKLHEEVNTMLGKISNLTYEMIRDRYEHFRSRCLNEKELKSKKETGCTQSLYGVKGKCVLNIVPKTKQVNSFTIDPKCKITKIIKK